MVNGSRWRWLMAACWLLLLPLLGGCAGAMRHYDTELYQISHALARGDDYQALRMLEQNNDTTDRDLLYYLEKGELLRLRKQFAGSRDMWMQADGFVRNWEDQARTSPARLLEGAGSFLINDKVRRYDGRDYEKVLLTARIALSHIALDDWASARTEIKKTHEREAVIAAMHVATYTAAEQEARQSGRDTSNPMSFRELNGYPVDTLDSPEVLALKNGYQNAFSHYLAGFIYEALDEPSLAAPGYRQAIELRPDVPMLQDALRLLDGRREKIPPGSTDVLFVVESGLAPARRSVTLPVPIPAAGLVPISFPVIQPSGVSGAIPPALQLDWRTDIPLAVITSVDVMARRALRDEMPGIMLRGLTRAAIKGAAQYSAGRKNNYAGLAVMLLSLATESADARGWRLLPESIAIGRAIIPSGTHTVSLALPGGGRRSIPVTVSGRYAVVPVRMLEQAVW
jgi:hypothetical protein